MGGYNLDLGVAIQQRHTVNQETKAFEHLGQGSFCSWKVEVLLYEEGKGWAFEEANLFQRIVWKVIKYLPLLNQIYNKVDLEQILPKLQKQKSDSSSPEVLELIARMKTLWERKTGKTYSESLPEPKEKHRRSNKSLRNATNGFCEKMAILVI